MRLKRSQACRMGVDDKKEENMRKGPWTFGEDMKLITYIRMNGAGRWNSVAKAAGLKRSGKSCRMRWLNYLRPDLKRGSITPNEQSLIFDLHRQWGNRWSRIARSLPGRTDNEIKNHWRTHIKKISRELVQSYRWPPASKTHSQIKAVRENNLCSSGKSFNGVRKECYAEFIAPKTLNKVGCDLCEVDDGNLESLTNQNKHQECIKKFSDMNTRSCMEAETYETSIAQYSPVCSCLSAIASQENVFSDSEDFLWDYNSIALWNLDDVCLPNVNEVIDL